MSRTASAISASVTVTKSASPSSSVAKVSSYVERVATPSAKVAARSVWRGAPACHPSCAADAPAAIYLCGEEGKELSGQHFYSRHLLRDRVNNGVDLYQGDEAFLAQYK